MSRHDTIETVDAEWRSTLHLDTVDPGNNFFELGGDSLTLIRLAWRLEQLLHVHVPTERLYERPYLWSVRQEYVSATTNTPNTGSDIRTVEHTTVPLSSVQQRMWNTLSHNGDLGYFNIGTAITVSSGTTATDLVDALRTITRRHAVLRTVFREDGDGVPYQWILPDIPLSCTEIPVTDSFSAPATRRAGNEFVSAPYDLAHGPLVRLALVRAPDHPPVALVGAHHLVYDGWSERIVTVELATLLDHASKPLPAVDVQYADYVAWERTDEAQRLVADDLRHWADRLAGAPTVVRYPGHDRSTGSVHGPATVCDADVPEEHLGGVRDLRAELGISAFAIVAAAYRLAIRRTFGLADVLIGTSVNLRNQQAFDQLVGLLAGSVTLRNPVAADESLRDVAVREHSVLAAAMAHSTASLDKVARVLGTTATGPVTPIFQIRLVFDGQLSGGTALVAPGWLFPDPPRARFDLALRLRGRDGLAGHVEGNESIIGAGSTRRLADAWQRIVLEAAR